MIEPRIIIKANNDQTSITIRVTAIDSPDWVDIVGTRIELSRDSSFSNIFYTNSTTHYKVRAYLDDEAPNQTIYGRVTLTKEDNTTLVKTFNFITPYPVLGTVKDEGNTQYITSLRKMDKNGNLSPRNYTNKAVSDAPAYIDIVADEAGEMVVANQWLRPVLVQNITQNLAQVEVARDASTTVAVNNGDIVRVTEQTANYSFRAFSDNYNPLCKGVSAHIAVMPPMERFASFKDGRIMGSYFFFAFNYNGTLTSLPEGSFDIHRLAYAKRGDSYIYGVFGHFNHSGALTSLPEGSFDTSNFIDNSDADYYYTNEYGNLVQAQHIQLSHLSFQGFNQLGALTSLPDGSFDFDNLKAINGSSIFDDFNNNGALTSLPDGSFGFSSFVNASNLITGITFNNFNARGRLVSLPDGAFHFHKNSILNNKGFAQFNGEGSLTSLPDHSFNFLIQRGSFSHFNYKGGITSLPTGSFRFVSAGNLTINDISFQNFNKEGALTSLPEGSFNLERVTTLPGEAFYGFNNTGALTSLPEDSFNFENVTSAGYTVCNEFNKNGALKSLPKGSFNFKNLTNIGYSFCSEFNKNGALEYLPIDSFSVNNVTSVYQSSSLGWQPFSGFNSDGKLTKSDTDYNPNHIYPTQSQITTITAYYYEPSTQTQFSETISGGNPFKYYQADYFNVVYSQSQAYTTDLADEYLSGQTITFTATAIDPEYMVTPTITTDGGTTVTFTDNGDNTFTFTMPQDNIDVAFTLTLPPARILLVAEEPGTMLVTNRWTTPIIVKNETQDTAPITIAGNSSSSIAVNLDDEISVEEGTAGNTFRNWRTSNYQTGLGLATGVLTRIDSMPEMDRFTANSNGTSVNRYFFADFCAGDSNGKGITALPAGSFDLSGITTPAHNFFENFNKKGLLTSLPAGSFDISGWTVLPSSVFMRFNDHGALTSLPIGSFDTGNVVTGGDTSTLNQTFEYFNYYGALTSLPTGSFNFDKLQTISRYWGTDSHSDAGFCAHFNDNGALTSLPAGSFNFPVLSSSNESGFCAYFNNRGALTSLPTGSFTFPMLTTVREFFFRDFNCQGEITSLPAGSFDTSNITSVENGFFYNFNKQGKLTSLPTGSFDISSITSVGNDFFDAFNNSGYIASLPTGSFILNSSLTTVGDWFFAGFNGYGKITSFPTGSFDISNITRVGNNFFSGFVSGSEATSLPNGSFRIQNITSIGTNFFANFARTSKLTSLPNGSFILNSSITSAPSNFFSDFLYQGKIASLPTGSFDTSNITTAGDYFFSGFYGETKSRISGSATLPDGSFKFNSLTTVGSNAFSNFNYQGALKTLPIASFGMHNLTSAGNNFCYGFNSSGNLETLSDSSFDLRNLTTVGSNFCYQFNMDGKLTYLPADSFNTNHITSAGSGFLTGFYGGEKSTTEYNPNFVNSLSSSITAYYLSGSSWSSESVASGAPLYYRQSNPWGSISYYTVAIAPSATNTLAENATIVSQTNLTDFISERLYVQGDCTVEAWYYMDSGTLRCNWSAPHSGGQQFPAQELQYQYGIEISLIDSSTYAHLTWNYTVGGIDKTSTVNTVRLTSQAEYTSLGASDKTDFDDITIGSTTLKWGAIKSFTFGDSPTTVPSNFLYNSGIETVDFGDVELTSISDGFLSSCEYLNCEISLPSTVTTIGNNFLSGDYNLDYPITGSNVTSVGNSCLRSCQSLNSSVSFPALVTIGDDFMHYCSAFTQSLSLNNVTTIGNYFLSQSFKFNSAISLPNVTSIGSNFLSSCELFNSAITFPKVTSIGGSFLSYAKKYNQTTTFPSTLTSIGASAFYYCSALNSTVSLSSAPVAIGQYFMLYCSSFNKAFTIPSSVVSIADGFMFGCSSMVSNITCSAPATIAATGNNTFSSNSTSVAQYSTGMKLTGTYKNDWKTRFPNRTSRPYRKLVVV